MVDRIFRGFSDASYREAQAHVGRGAEAHVKLALWCEAHGLQTERLKHLAIAVVTDPAHATARGLVGLVAYHGHWQRPDAVAEAVKSGEALTAALAEYNSRRVRTDGRGRVFVPRFVEPSPFRRHTLSQETAEITP